MTYITIEIIDGLGNQLFQIAFIHYLNKKLKNKKEIVFEQISDMQTYWNTLFKNEFKTNMNDILFDYQYNEEINHHYDVNIPDSIDINIFIKGKFQSFKYIDDTLRDDLIYKIYSNEDLMYEAYDKYNEIKRFFNQNTEDDDIVSIHHEKKDTYNLSINYYKKAFDIVKRKYLVVFSHDTENSKMIFDKTQYNYEKIYFAHFESIELEFLVLSMIKHNIISNSTFSLWASFINAYPDRKIIAPKKWYSDKYPYDRNEIYHKYITHII